MKPTIGIIGGGNMGGAIVAGIAGEYRVFVCEQDRSRSAKLRKKYKVGICDLKAVMKHARVIILAVKPQGMDALLKEVRPLLTKDKLIVSIAAGITCGFIERRLGSKVRVVRTMPNLPVQVGQGMTAVCPGKAAKRSDLIQVCRIFGRVGRSIVVEEKWMNAVTAVSGSGPAYVFQFIEQFNNAARSLGLDPNLSKDLVLQTVRGSLDLLERQKSDAGVLRAKVTSKGGTTKAALDVFGKKQTDQIFREALKAAKQRAKELSQ